MNLRSFSRLRLARTIALAAPLLGLGSFAQAALVTFTPSAGGSNVIGSINESPYGLPPTGGAVNAMNLTGLTGQNNVTVGPAGSTVNIVGTNISNAGGSPTSSPIVQGSQSGFAAPVVNSSGALLSTPYLSTGGQPGAITLTFSTPEKYLGFLWGSIDPNNTISFSLSDGSTQTISGNQGLSAASGPGSGIAGSQTFGGSQYILINFLGGLTFNKVVLSQGPGYPSFEAGLFQYSASNQVPLPEPTSIALVGIGAAALLVRRRKARALMAA